MYGRKPVLLSQPYIPLLSLLFERVIRLYDASPPLRFSCFSSGFPVERPTASRREPGVFAVQGVGHPNAPIPIGQVFLVYRFDLIQVILKRGFERVGQHRDPIFEYKE